MNILVQWIIPAISAIGLMIVAMTFFSQLTQPKFDTAIIGPYPKNMSYYGNYVDPKVAVLDEMTLTSPIQGCTLPAPITPPPRYGENIVVCELPFWEPPKHPMPELKNRNLTCRIFTSQNV